MRTIMDKYLFRWLCISSKANTYWSCGKCADACQDKSTYSSFNSYLQLITFMGEKKHAAELSTYVTPTSTKGENCICCDLCMPGQHSLCFRHPRRRNHYYQGRSSPPPYPLQSLLISHDPEGCDSLTDAGLWSPSHQDEKSTIPYEIDIQTK